eukprot:4361074-Pyramimonas_sp.AAC.2
MQRRSRVSWSEAATKGTRLLRGAAIKGTLTVVNTNLQLMTRCGKHYPLERPSLGRLNMPVNCNVVLSTDDPLERDLFDTSEQVRLKEVGDFWLLGQCDGVVLSPQSAFADRALALALHTPLTVRCGLDETKLGKAMRDVHKHSGNETRMVGAAGVNATVALGWDCRYVQLKDGPTFPSAAT